MYTVKTIMRTVIETRDYDLALAYFNATDGNYVELAEVTYIDGNYTSKSICIRYR